MKLKVEFNTSLDRLKNYNKIFVQHFRIIYEKRY